MTIWVLVTPVILTGMPAAMAAEHAKTNAQCLRATLEMERSKYIFSASHSFLAGFAGR